MGSLHCQGLKCGLIHLPAKRQELRTRCTHPSKAIGESIVSVCAGEKPLQFIESDIADDGYMRFATDVLIVPRHCLQRLSIPRQAKRCAQSVAIPARRLQRAAHLALSPASVYRGHLYL